MKRLLTAAAGLLFALSATAKEGMWLPFLLQNYPDMVASGLQLSREDIYDLNNASLKDAVVSFGGFCTGELISPKGLVLTNHHCGYGNIQDHSSVENDLLKNGFWAKSLEQELKNPDLFVSFIVSMEDVTNQVLEGITNDLTEAERQKAIEDKAGALANSSLPPGIGYESEVVPFAYGNQYILIVSRKYSDVRLVGAPPSSIGKYGSDTDNWVWPRHTGDFSLFRIYADANNEPAPPSDNNRPYVPRKFLEIALNGVNEGDFTMVLGFPGTTQEYLPSEKVRLKMNSINPIRIGARDIRLGVLDRHMRKDDATRIRYASHYAGVANSWKKWKGESLGLEFSRAVETKKEEESRLEALIAKDPVLYGKYGGVVERLNQLSLEMQRLEELQTIFIEVIWQGLDARGIWNIYRRYELPLSEEKASGLGERVKAFYENYDRTIDRETTAELIPFYIEQMGGDLPQAWKEALEDEDGAAGLVKELFRSSWLVSEEGERESVELAAKKPEKLLKKVRKDDYYVLLQSSLDHYLEMASRYAPMEEEFSRLMRLHVASIAATGLYGTFYPDANSTLRVTYGKVEGMEPRDAVHYVPFTDLDGVMAKYLPGDYEFDLPQRLLNLHERELYGRYANENGELPVCFLGSNHTTGGNSGSPALNGKGQLVGLNFDRTWEGTMSDVNYDLRLCRNIMVDIRYVLWNIEYIGEAGYLIDEMSLVTN